MPVKTAGSVFLIILVCGIYIGDFSGKALDILIYLYITLLTSVMIGFLQPTWLVTYIETYKQPPTQFTRKAQPQVCNHHVIILIYTVYTIHPHTQTHRHTHTNHSYITYMSTYVQTHACTRTNTHTQEGVPYSL